MLRFPTNFTPFSGPKREFRWGEPCGAFGIEKGDPFDRVALTTPILTLSQTRTLPAQGQWGIALSSDFPSESCLSVDRSPRFPIILTPFPRGEGNSQGAVGGVYGPISCAFAKSGFPLTRSRKAPHPYPAPPHEPNAELLRLAEVFAKVPFPSLRLRREN
jgi:hypothetical protein